MKKFALMSEYAAAVLGMISFYYLIKEDMYSMSLFLGPSLIFLGARWMLIKKMNGGKYGPKKYTG